MQVVQGLVVSIGLMFAMATTTSTEVYVKEPNPCEISAEQCVIKYFPEDSKVAIAVFKAESQLKANAVGVNISTTTRMIKSVDCGIAQINVKATACPSELLHLETNLKVARALYDERSWQPWVVYNTGRYIKYLD